MSFLETKFAAFVLVPQKPSAFVLASQKLTTFVFRRPFFRQQAREGESRYCTCKGGAGEWKADNIGIQYPE